MFRFLVVSFLFTVACSGSGSSSATHDGTGPNSTSKVGNYLSDITARIVKQAIHQDTSEAAEVAASAQLLSGGD